MSIAAADLVAYCAANMPEDDTSTVGGAIDALRRIVFTDIAATDQVEVLSSAAGDNTQTATVYYRLATGVYTNEVLALNGTTAVATAGSAERIERVELSAVCVGTITVRRKTGATLIQTIPIGERGFRRLFINSFSDPSAPKPYYMKFFWKNTHGSLAFLSAVVKENADPLTLITHALEDAVNDSHTTANRLTAPVANVTAFDGTDKNVAGTDLAFSAAQGVWLKLSLGTGEAAHKSTYTSEIDGNSI